jgi:hypothetical protein
MVTRTKTKYINCKTLLARGESAITVIKLMMACTDLSLANEALYEWKKEKPRIKKDRQNAAGMYFVRLQIAHLFEALKIIELIRNTSVLLDLVKRCDARTQESFKNLEHYLPGGSKRTEINRIITKVRNNITFHYDETGKIIKTALSDMAEKSDGQISSLTRGNTAYLWNFKIADNLVDSIMVHQIWKISNTVDLQFEADKIVDNLHQIFLLFMDFSGEFIWKYFEN